MTLVIMDLKIVNLIIINILSNLFTKFDNYKYVNEDISMPPSQPLFVDDADNYEP